MRAQAAQATITHAVIGTEERIDFGISNDAAFFQILSSSLYKNPLLAVIRETMCNAHDAHIMGGVQKPIVIKFDYDESTISFRDFGPGIPHDLIGPVYGVYGASTKKADKRQTGSFGLGCKSPFAYVEHFEVTSWNHGTMSLYNMSRSSAAKDGTPGITRLLNIATTETGLQVKFKIQQSDISKIRQYIERIAYLGGIPTRIELGEEPAVALLPMVPLVRIPGEWTLINNNMLVGGESIHGHVFVRYGTVIYPVDMHAEYRLILSNIVAFVQNHTASQSLLIEAVPDSLVVMPNRESLSLQDQTVASLKSLLTTFYTENLTRKFYIELVKAGKAVLDQSFKQTGTTSILAWNVLIGREVNNSYYSDSTPTVQLISNVPPLTSIAQANVHRVFRRFYGSHKNLFKTITMHRARLLENAPGMDRGFVQSYFQARLYTPKPKSLRKLKAVPQEFFVNPEKTNLKCWYLTQVAGPVAAALRADDLPVKNNLLMYGRIPGESNYGRRFRNSRIGFGTINNILDRTASEATLIIALERKIILTTSARLLESNTTTIFNTFFKGRDAHGLLAYVLPPKKEQQEKARKALIRLNYEIIDLTVDSDWKNESTKAIPAEPRTKKPVIEGRRTLLSYYRSGYLRKETEEGDTKERITAPKFYAYLVRDRHDNNATNIELIKRPSLSLVNSLGSFGVGVETANSIPVLRNAGVPCMAEYLFSNLHAHMLSSQTFKQGFEYDLVSYVRSLNPDQDVPAICKIVQMVPELRNHFKLLDPMTDDDRLAWRWWSYLKNIQYQRLQPWQYYDEQVKFIDGKRYAYMQEIDAFLKTLKYDDSLAGVWDLVETNPLLKFLDLGQIANRLLDKNNPMDPTAKKHLIEMLLSAINV